MADDLDTYTIEETGEVIFSAHFLQKKARCCKSTCLHCPYGLTLSKINIKFNDFDGDYARLNQVLNENEYNRPVSIADQLMADNLGSKRKTLVLSSVKKDLIKVITLKGYFIGFVIIKSGLIDKWFLSKHFQFQNISKQIIDEHFKA